MQNELFSKFKFEEKAPEVIIEKYNGRIPEQLMEVWKQYGFGSILNGYLKLINPDNFIEPLEEYIQEVAKLSRYLLHRWEILLFGKKEDI